MPISTPELQALARLTPQQIADRVLQLDQERRYYVKVGALVWAAECNREIDQLAVVFQAA